MFNKNILFSLLAIVVFSGCTSNNAAKVANIESNNNLSSEKEIFKYILEKNIDKADDAYINLKNSTENREVLARAATNLAIAHIAKKENILANFYIQEALQNNPNSSMLHFLLVKNQFLAASKNSSDSSYMQRALSALETNRGLLSSSDYIVLANSMNTRVKLTIALNNKDVSNLYKRLNKESASSFYDEKAQILGIDIKEIIRP